MEIILPIAVVVVLPVLIVWLISRVNINRENRRSEVLLEAIKKGADVDAGRLADFFARDSRAPGELRNLRLLRGCIFTLIGVALGVVELIITNSGGFDTDDIMGIGVLGAVSLAVGISYLIVFKFSGSKEEKQLRQ